MGAQPAFDTSQPAAHLMSLLRESSDRCSPLDSALLVPVLRALLRDLSHTQARPVFGCSQVLQYGMTVCMPLAVQKCSRGLPLLKRLCTTALLEDGSRSAQLLAVLRHELDFLGPSAGRLLDNDPLRAEALADSASSIIGTEDLCLSPVCVVLCVVFTLIRVITIRNCVRLLLY